MTSRLLHRSISRGELEMASIGREDGRYYLELVTLGRLLVRPVHHHCGTTDHSRHMHHNIRLRCGEKDEMSPESTDAGQEVLTNATMSSSSEHQPILRVTRVLVDSSWHPSLGNKFVGVRVYGWIVERLAVRNE